MRLQNHPSTGRDSQGEKLYAQRNPRGPPDFGFDRSHGARANADRRAEDRKAAESSLRIDVALLDRLMNLVGELSLARAGIQLILDELRADRGRADLARTLHREVRALDRNGKKFETEARGLEAVCIQHEMDHLQGKVFVEYLSRLKQNRIKAIRCKGEGTVIQFAFSFRTLKHAAINE